jgi:hypothetical protein
MALIIGDDGEPHVAQPDSEDPVRRANRKFVEDLAYRLEMDIQVVEAFDAHVARLNERADRLEARIAFLEQMLTGVAA